MDDKKAYVVHSFDGEGTIVFATNGAEARRFGANSLDISFEDVESCCRCHWADGYTNSHDIPASLMIENGWWFEECNHCGISMNDSALEDGEKPVSGVVGFLGGLIFCCAECASSYYEDKRICKEAEAEMLASLHKRILRRFPDAVLAQEKDHAYATRKDGVVFVKQAKASFDFTGRKHGLASLCFDLDTCDHPPYSKFIGPIRPAWFCCSGDKDEFEAFAAKQLIKRNSLPQNMQEVA